MAPPVGEAPAKGKGKGKNKGKSLEGTEQKTARMTAELAAAVAARDFALAQYTSDALDGHLASPYWRPPQESTLQSATKGAGKSKGRVGENLQQNDLDWSAVEPDSWTTVRGKAKGKGKGKEKGSFAATNLANLRVNQTQKQLDDAADVAFKAAADRAAAKTVREESQAANAQRNAEKKEAKRVADEERRASGNATRPTRLCVRCYYAGTYESSTKCYGCKKPFDGPCPAPVTTTSTPPTGKPAPPTQAATTLEELKKAAIAGIPSYAKVTALLPPPPPLLKAVSFAALPKQPAAHPPAGKPPPPAPPAPPGGGVPPKAAPPTVVVLAAADAAADLDGAKKLNALRLQKEKAEAELALFEDAPAVQAALRERIGQIVAETEQLKATRQAALEPHQLGQVLSKAQLDSSGAAAVAKSTQDAADARLVAFDAQANEENNGYIEFVKSLLAAQEAAKALALEQRGELIAALQLSTKAAHDKAAEAKRLLDTVQATQAHKSGSAQAAADAAAAAAAAQQQATASNTAALQQQHLAQQTTLQAQLDAQALELAE